MAVLLVLATTSAAAQTAPWRVVQAPDGSLFVLRDGVRQRLQPDAISESDLGELPEREPIMGTLPVPGTSATATSAAPHLTVVSVATAEGAVVNAGSLWIVGEVRNDGPTAVGNIRVTGRLLDIEGTVIGSAAEDFGFLAPGQTTGVAVRLRNPPSFRSADLVVTADPAAADGFVPLAIGDLTLRQVGDTAAPQFRAAGRVVNPSARAVGRFTIVTWFLGADDQVVDVQVRGPFANATSLAPGAAYIFDMAATPARYLPRAAGIIQTRSIAYARPS
ncbi:MAG: hypothetical protein HYX52_02970 [Chloroflexi bacterium]|nr:hypothetical protein [Chloroflexota bacterium]